MTPAKTRRVLAVVEVARSLLPRAGDAGLRAALADLDAYSEPPPEGVLAKLEALRERWAGPEPTRVFESEARQLLQDCEPNSPEQLAVEIFLTQCARAVP